MHPSEKIAASLEDLKIRCDSIRESGKTIVLTSGCFDLLHGGHVEYVWDAGERGFLVVGINSDVSVRKLKGKSRPARGQEDRAKVMACMYSVALVAIFDCDYALIEAVKPKIYVASSTSHVRVWDDSRRIVLLEKLGTEIVELGGKKEDSTTNIIARITRMTKS